MKNIKSLSPKKFRHSASFGKRQEFVLMSELLKRGFDVYMTLVDDQGIDCIIRKDEQCFIDIQIKARSEVAKQGCTFAAMTVKPRSNYFFMFYTESTDTVWVVPSVELKKLCYTNANGKNSGKSSIIFPKSEKSTRWKAFGKYRDENGFQLLKNFEEDKKGKRTNA